MTFEYVLYLFLGIATTATEIALISSYYRIKGEIMFYPLFITVATIGVILGGSLLPNSQFSKIFVLLMLYCVLWAFCGKLPSMFYFVPISILAANNGLVSSILFQGNQILSLTANIILNVSLIYVVRVIEFRLDLKPVVKKTILIISILMALSFSILITM